MLQTLSALGLGQLRKLPADAVGAIASATTNMHRLGFSVDNTNILLRVLYLEPSKQDLREAWFIFDRGRRGHLSRMFMQEALVEIVGDACRDHVAEILKRVCRTECIVELIVDASEPATSIADRVSHTQFESVVRHWRSSLRKGGGGGSSESVATVAARELGSWAADVAQDTRDALVPFSVFEASFAANVPLRALPRAGAVVRRMLDAGHSEGEAKTAVRALFIERSELPLLRLWGVFDTARVGIVSAIVFDRAMRCSAFDASLTTSASLPAAWPNYHAVPSSPFAVPLLPDLLPDPPPASPAACPAHRSSAATQDALRRRRGPARRPALDVGLHRSQIYPTHGV
jgi:hypothetical protein